jgi:hypothetical protein
MASDDESQPERSESMADSPEPVPGYVRVAIAGTLAFGILLAVPFFILSNLIEVRAQMASLVMIAPAALLGLENLLAKGRPDPSAADR